MPRFVQMVRWESASAILQLPARWPDGCHIELHMRLFRRPSALFQVARQARGCDIFPTGDATQTARDDMVKGQVIA